MADIHGSPGGEAQMPAAAGAGPAPAPYAGPDAGAANVTYDVGSVPFSTPGVEVMGGVSGNAVQESGYAHDMNAGLVTPFYAGDISPVGVHGDADAGGRDVTVKNLQSDGKALAASGETRLAKCFIRINAVPFDVVVVLRRPTGVGQPDEMPPPIGRVAAPLDQLARLEIVEQADEVAPVVAESVRDHRLRLTRLLAKERENGVVVRRHPGLLERLHRLTHLPVSERAHASGE